MYNIIIKLYNNTNYQQINESFYAKLLNIFCKFVV